MRILRNEEGQTLVLTWICASALVGFIGMALDVGILFRARRDAQTAADSAAVASALDYYYNYALLGASPALTHAVNAGKTAAAANGISNSSNVTINCAPSSGPEVSATCNGYFEARVIEPSHTIFMSTFSQLLGASNFQSINVSARAVAGTPVVSNACIWITKPSGADVLHLQGNSNINAPGCGIYVNSSD